jgi:hypothetical protein
VRRVESVEAFASLQRDDWPRIAVDACRLAIAASGVNDQPALDALHAVELRRADPDAAASMRSLAERLDEDAWDAQEAGDEARYEVLFRRSRAVSSLAFALSGEPDEAIYEAAYAVGTPEDLIRRLPP